MSLTVQSSTNPAAAAVTLQDAATAGLASLTSTADSLLSDSAQTTASANPLQSLAAVFDVMLTMIAAIATYLFQSLGGQTGSSSSGSSGGSSSSTGTGTTTGSGSTTGTGSTNTTTPAEQVKTLKLLSVSDEGAGKFSVKTPDGYTVSTEGKEQAWYITDPTGKKTRISGDLKLVESDGDTLTLAGQSTLKFGKNKVTVEVAGGKTAKITVYNTTERVTFSGLNTDQPVIDGAGQDARSDDHKRLDKDVYRLGKEKNGEDQWRKVAA